MVIQYVIAIHRMRWLTNFYDFRFKGTATAGIGIHPNKAWLSKLVNFKNAIWTLEERYAIKFSLNLEKMQCYESWIYCYEADIKRQSYQWKSCWLRQTQEGQTEQIHPQTFDDPFFWQHCHDLRALGFHLTVNKEYYVEVLRESRERFRRKRPVLFK